MITVDGKWTMEGLESEDEKVIKTHRELSDFINEVGFLPLFKNNVNGFSVEELTVATAWWGENKEEDPWEWREMIASEGKIAYGKLFSGKAGFVSREWYPVFAAYRRDGYDFDSRYEDGLASKKSKKIIDVLECYDTLPSYEIKSLAGFGKTLEKGFDSTMNLLQMQTYLTVRGFRRKVNKKGEEYGWPVAVYSLSERLFGKDYVRSAYYLEGNKAKEMIIEHLLSKFPEASSEEMIKCIK